MFFGGGHLGFPIGIKNRNFVEDLPMNIPGQSRHKKQKHGKGHSNDHFISEQKS